MNRRLRPWWLRIAALAVLLAGCAVDTQSQPETIDRDDIPFDLLAKAPPPDVKSGPAPYAYTVFLVDSRGLVESPRSGEELPGLENVLRALTKGLTESERRAGLRTKIPPGTTIRRVQIVGSVVIVDLGGAFDTATGNDRIVGLAQLVYTATSAVPQDQVRFELYSRAIEVPRGDGALTNDPVGSEDYPQAVIERLATVSNAASRP